MSKNKFLPLLLITSFLFVAAGCTAQRTPPAGAFPPGGQSTTAATATTTSQPATEAATATPESSNGSPVATQDFISLLVTQAYSQVTLTPHATQVAPTEAATAMDIPAGIAQYLTPTPTLDPAPASVIFTKPIQITNAVNAADCKIRSVGDCTTVMQAGNTLFFTFTFGVEGAQSFKWSDAAVVVTRNGAAYTWSQTGNMLVKAPDFTKDESWTLNVGQSAKFAGSLDNAQPGSYTAELMMCTLSPEECSAGQGWQSVGGEAIHFVIEP